MDIENLKKNQKSARLSTGIVRKALNNYFNTKGFLQEMDNRMLIKMFLPLNIYSVEPVLRERKKYKNSSQSQISLKIKEELIGELEKFENSLNFKEFENDTSFPSIENGLIKSTSKVIINEKKNAIQNIPENFSILKDLKKTLETIKNSKNFIFLTYRKNTRKYQGTLSEMNDPHVVKISLIF